MDILWNNRNARHWTQEGEDWLCLRLSASDAVSSVILAEDSHHYFKEVHIHTEDREGPNLESHRLDGPGPCEIPLDNMGECIVLARVFFFKYYRAPCPAGEAYPVCCGEVTRTNGSNPQRLMMQIGHEPPTTRGAQRPPASVEDVLRKVIRVRGVAIPQLVRSGDEGAVPFMLHEEARTETCVFMFKQAAPLAVFTPGQQVALRDWIRPEIDRCEIAVGGWSPALAKTSTDWSVAVPVAKRDATSGIAGAPFIIRPLISGLKVTPQAPGGVYAEWSWHGPAQWMKVRLCWEFYDKHGYADTPPQMVYVTKAEYDRRGVFEFLNYTRMPGLKDWCVQVTASPLLLGTEVTAFPELETTARL